jgi:membrane protein DedA with SNARE-associated domain
MHQFLSHYSVALFASVLAGQAGLPIPEVPLLLAAASLASLGRGSIAESMALAILACLIADGFWYEMGRRRRLKLFEGSERSIQLKDPSLDVIA